MKMSLRQKRIMHSHACSVWRPYKEVLYCIVLVSAIFVLGLCFCNTAWAATQSVSYQAATLSNNKPVYSTKTATATVIDAAYLTSVGNKIQNGTYVLQTLSYNQRIEITSGASVSFIIPDGVVFSVQGIRLPPNATLTIYSQAQGTGKLIASAYSIYAGIGGGAYIGNENYILEGGGNLVVHGGVIEASATYGAGIGASAAWGSSSNGWGSTTSVSGGSLTVYGGSVLGKSTHSGAGIGGAGVNSNGTGDVYGSNGSTIKVYGGQVTGMFVASAADTSSVLNTDERAGVGIGGGARANAGTIEVWGGTVVGISDVSALSSKLSGKYPGIGASVGSTGGRLIVHGGQVRGSSIQGTVGIGLGENGSSGSYKYTLDGGAIDFGEWSGARSSLGPVRTAAPNKGILRQMGGWGMAGSTFTFPVGFKLGEPINTSYSTSYPAAGSDADKLSINSGQTAINPEGNTLVLKSTTPRLTINSGGTLINKGDVRYGPGLQSVNVISNTGTIIPRPLPSAPLIQSTTQGTNTTLGTITLSPLVQPDTNLVSDSYRSTYGQTTTTITSNTLSVPRGVDSVSFALSRKKLIENPFYMTGDTSSVGLSSQVSFQAQSGATYNPYNDYEKTHKGSLVATTQTYPVTLEDMSFVDNSSSPTQVFLEPFSVVSSIAANKTSQQVATIAARGDIPFNKASSQVLKVTFDEGPFSGVSRNVTFTTETITGPYALKVKAVRRNTTTPLSDMLISLYSDVNGSQGDKLSLGHLQDDSSIAVSSNSFTTDSQGEVGAYLLRANTSYWVVPENAPEGMLIPDPVKITVSSDGTSVTSSTGRALSVDSQGLPLLYLGYGEPLVMPTTGSSDALTLIVAGLLLCVSGGLAVGYRKIRATYQILQFGKQIVFTRSSR